MVGITGVTLERLEGSGRKKLSSYSVTQDIKGELTGLEIIHRIQEYVSDTARAALKEEQAKGFEKNPIIIVDGKKGKSMDDVNPWGKIEIETRQEVRSILLEIFAEIIKKSKVVTGQYKNSFWVMFNNSVIARSEPEFKTFLANLKKDFEKDDEFVFINTAPYANFLEKEGITSDSGFRPVRVRLRRKREGKGFVGPLQKTIRQPNGVMTMSMRLINKKYKNQARIKYVQVFGGSIGLTSPPAGSGVGRTRRKKGKGQGRPYMYPAISFRINEEVST